MIMENIRIAKKDGKEEVIIPTLDGNFLLEEYCDCLNKNMVKHEKKN